MASMSVADSSLGDNLTAWKVVGGDHEGPGWSGEKLLSVNSAIKDGTLVRVLHIGDLFLTVGSPTMVGRLYTYHQLEDGAWVLSTESGQYDDRTEKLKKKSWRYRFRPKTTQKRRPHKTPSKRKKNKTPTRPRPPN